jgi:hypothetical protein
MDEVRKNRLKEILEWLHHAYWIREFLISSGIAVAAMKWFVSHIPTLSQYGWALWPLFAGLIMYGIAIVRERCARISGSTPALNEITQRPPFPRDELLKVIDDAVQDAKRAGGQAGILWNLAARATELTQRLEETWHDWNTAGEHLVHPLDARLDKLKDPSSDEAWRLLNGRRDFMVLYAAHFSHLRAEFPGFLSMLVQNGYPSDKKYSEVLNSLRDHTARLEEKAQDIWDTEIPAADLYATGV